MMSSEKTTHFGFETVEWDEKEQKVAAVFNAVAQNYDFMNDIMSLGIHRLWKRLTVELAQVRNTHTILDLAGGSGDLSRLLCKSAKPYVVLADINAEMLNLGRDRLIDQGAHANSAAILANAENLPFANNSFDCIIIGFGLRNFTDKTKALKSALRTCKPGGKIMILEFSTPKLPYLKPIYELYLLKILPKLGEFFAHDATSYRYLAESISVHPSQDELKSLIERAGFEDCYYYNFSGGIVALHIAYKY